MKKIFAIALGSLAFSALFISCDKAFEQPSNYSSVAVIHASPVSATVPTDTLNVFVDTAKYTSSGITYTGNSTYLPILSGSKPINIRRKPSYTSSLYVSEFTYSFETGKAYSFFVYDTTTSATGVAKVIRLADDLSLPAAATSKVRFLHLAPNGAAVDVTLLRTSVTPNDSITIANKSYVGASPNEDALSAFMSIPRGTYTAKIKTAGTQTVLTSSTITLLTATATGASVNEGRIVTLFATGTAKGRPLAIGAFRHY